MRIIAGSAKGRRLSTPRGDHIRPVLDKVKESIFNILFDVEGLKVLDVFAGTGSIGLEAVSRGAEHATFIDKDREALNLIKHNIKLCHFGSQCTILPYPAKKAIQFLRKEEDKFDIIFVDPPYLKDLVEYTIWDIIESDLLAKGGTIVSEHHPKEQINELPHSYKITDQRAYGQTLISFIKKAEP